jgi:hypothetical protein
MRQPFVTVLALASLSVPGVVHAQNTGAPPAVAHRTLAQLPPDSLQRARKYATWLLTARSDSLFRSLDSISRGQFESVSVMDDIAAQLAVTSGSEERLIEERWVNRLGKRQYWRTSKYTNSDEPVILRLVMLPTGELAGIGMNPVSHAPPTDP